jgi:hypothetical protein
MRMPKASPFRTDTELTPRDAAFTDVVYRRQNGALEVYGVRDFSPTVICSPKKTGKTTQMNEICAQQESVSVNNRISFIRITIPSHRRAPSEEFLRRQLKDALRSNKSGTLTDLIETSTVLKDDDQRKILAIVDADNLDTEALMWLLYNIRELAERGTVPKRYGVQIIVDGSFALDTLTQGPNSEFPLPGLFPREFTYQQQNHFVRSRLRGLNIELPPLACDSLWRYTGGDKYLTQALCLRMTNHFGGDASSMEVIDEARLETIVQGYLSEDPKRDALKTALIDAFMELAELESGDEDKVRDLLPSIGERWESLPHQVRQVAYKGGIVRRKNSLEVVLRSPLVLNLFTAMTERVREVKAILDCWFTLDGVPEQYVDAARQSIRDIVEAAYCNTIAELDVGYGRKLDHNRISLNAFGLKRGRYSGTLEIKTPDSIKVGDEVWCILWSRDLTEGQRTSKTRIIPVRQF